MYKTPKYKHTRTCMIVHRASTLEAHLEDTDHEEIQQQTNKHVGPHKRLAGVFVEQRQHCDKPDHSMACLYKAATEWVVARWGTGWKWVKETKSHFASA